MYKIAYKTKCRTIEKDRWKRKEYIKESRTEDTKEIIKNTLHIRDIKVNYKRQEMTTKCPIRQVEEDSTENISHCQVENTWDKFNLLD